MNTDANASIGFTWLHGIPQSDNEIMTSGLMRKLVVDNCIQHNGSGKVEVGSKSRLCGVTPQRPERGRSNRLPFTLIFCHWHRQQICSWNPWPGELFSWNQTMLGIVRRCNCFFFCQRISISSQSSGSDC